MTNYGGMTIKYMNILGTGLSGMVGSRITELLQERHTLQDISLDTGIDIRDRDKVLAAVKKSDASWVFHFAALADVDKCESDFRLQTSDFRQINWEEYKKQSASFAVNVLGTKNIVDAAKKFGKRLLYISTDFVFEGIKKTSYTEEDTPNPVNQYGYTKYLGEQIVQDSLQDGLIVRITYPYGARHPVRKDFVQRIQERLQAGASVDGVTDIIFTPTFIDDIADAMEMLIQKNAAGIYHVVGSESLSPYDAAVAIAARFGYDNGFIRKSTMEKYYRGCAPRPQYLRTSNEKIRELGVQMKGFREGLEKISNF